MKYINYRGYGLDKQPGEGVKDKMPEWLNGFAENAGIMKKTASTEKKHPFYGIDDPILNPERLGLDE